MSLPDLNDLIFKNRDQKYDECRWSLLKWILNFDDEFLEKIKLNTQFKNLSTVIITLQFLIQVK